MKKQMFSLKQRNISYFLLEQQFMYINFLATKEIQNSMVEMVLKDDLLQTMLVLWILQTKYSDFSNRRSQIRDKLS